VKYRKRPVVIEALQWWPDDPQAAGEMIGWTNFQFSIGDRLELLIETLEGVMAASPGDFVVKDVQGEFYPVKPDIFEATYEPVE
jgi:hypothetical protein